MNKETKEKIVNNNNRIYVTLDNTNFNVGDKYEYTYNKADNQLSVKKSEIGNTVSKKRSGKNIKPLIDIRNKAILSKFKNFEQLKIQVFDNEVVVTGYKEKISSKIASKILSFTKIQSQFRQKEYVQLSFDFDSLDKVIGDSVTISTSDSTLSSLAESKEMKYVLKVVSLFSGAGFSDFGLSQATNESIRFELVKAYDYDENACATYRHNLGNHIEKKDITKLDFNAIPNAQVMVLTPSCFGFSNCNRSSNVERKAEQNDLTKYAVEAIKSNKGCQVFVMENSPQLLTHEKGAYLNYILNELSDFEISYGVLNSADFGVPQLRKRAFLIGSKIGKIELPRATHKPDSYTTVWDALSDIAELNMSHLPNHDDCSQSSDIVKERMSYIPWGGNVKDIPEEIRPKSQMSNAYKRLHPNQPSPSIVNYRKTLISPYYADRTLSVLEAKTLMGVPYSYEILGTLSSKQQQTCNGVTPPVIKAVGEMILNAFELFYKKNNISLFPTC